MRKKAFITSWPLWSKKIDETSPTDAKNEHVANWLTANGKNNQKKQHFEKTVGEIDRIVEELKMKGVQEPTKRYHTNKLQAFLY